MLKRTKIAVGCAVAVVIFVAVALGAARKMDRDHEWWHSCRQNCWLIDDGKRICAENRGLPDGATVTWQDIEPFLSKSIYWGSQVPSARGIPKCPAGGTYALNPIGSWSMCSVEYHRWSNCKSRDQGSAWRN